MKHEQMLSKKLPIAKLAGVIENTEGSGSCRLVFALQPDDSVDDPGGYVYLNYGLMLDALRFAQEQGIIPSLY